jgi:hypothetical protein
MWRQPRHIFFNIENLVLIGGSYFNGSAGKDGKRFWSSGVRIIYDFRLLIAD